MSESALELAGLLPNEAPPVITARTPRSLRQVVPEDPWLTVRLIGFAALTVGYLLWFFEKGLIIDRISVGISVGIFIVIGHLGRPLRRWAWLVFDGLSYSVMWLVYEESRGWAGRAGFPLQVQAPRNIDRFLFFGTDPNVWIQRHFYNANTIRWYDKVASATYFTHFILPVIAIAVLWVTNHREWARLMKRLSTLLFVACTMFVLLPTAPPWMVSKNYHLIGHLARHTARGFRALGLKGFVNSWQFALNWGNAVAAMPSLHSAFALFVPAFFLPRIKPVWLKAIVLCFPVIMLASLVYFAEHWVIDGVVGWVIVGLSFLFWGWFERRQLRVRAARGSRPGPLVPRPGRSGVTWSLRSRPATPKVRAILLDGGFIGALIATDAPQHVSACRLYATLVDRYAAGLDRLFSLGEVLDNLPREFRRNALAPVLTVRVARQHRSAARRITDRSPDVALSLVMMRRERIHAVATIGHEFDDVKVAVLFADDATLDLDVEAAALQASVSSETAPTPAPQSTHG